MRRFVVSVCLALLVSCGGSDPLDPGNEDDGGDDGSGGTPGIGTMTAQISDTAWASESTRLTATLDPNLPGALVVSGTQFVGLTGSRTLTLYLAYLAGPGALPLGVTTLTTAGGAAAIQIVNGSTATSYQTKADGAAGTFTVVSLSATRLVAQFSFTASPVTGTGSARNVTGGTLDITLPAGFAPAPATNRGSRVSATIETHPWNAATVVASGTLASGPLSFGGTNTDYGVSITALQPATVDTIPLDPGVISLVVQELGTSKFWGGLGSTGQIVFTSVGGGYAVGTFEGMLEPSSGGATGTLSVTNGTFSVRFPN